MFAALAEASEVDSAKLAEYEAESEEGIETGTPSEPEAKQSESITAFRSVMREPVLPVTNVPAKVQIHQCPHCRRLLDGVRAVSPLTGDGTTLGGGAQEGPHSQPESTTALLPAPIASEAIEPE